MAEELLQQVLGVDLVEPAGLAPEPRTDADGHVRVLGERRKLAEARLLALGEKLQADRKRLVDGAMTGGVVPGVERRKTARLQAPVDVGNRLCERPAPAEHAVAQEAVDEGELQRPFPEPRRQRQQRGALGLAWLGRQPLGEKRHRLPALHGIDRDPERIRRQDMLQAGGDETGGVAPSLEEGLKILLAPDVVDDEQMASFAESGGERGAQGTDGLQPRPLAGQHLDEVGDAGEEVVGLLPQLNVQDAVAVGRADVGVAAETVGKRGLAEAARAPQRHDAALAVEEPRLQRRRLLVPLDEASGRFRSHERDAAPSQRTVGGRFGQPHRSPPACESRSALRGQIDFAGRPTCRPPRGHGLAQHFRGRQCQRVPELPDRGDLEERGPLSLGRGLAARGEVRTVGCRHDEQHARSRRRVAIEALARGGELLAHMAHGSDRQIDGAHRARDPQHAVRPLALLCQSAGRVQRVCGEHAELPARAGIDPARDIEAIAGVAEQALDDAGRARHERVIGRIDIRRLGGAADARYRAADGGVLLGQQQNLDGTRRRGYQDAKFFPLIAHRYDFGAINMGARRTTGPPRPPADAEHGQGIARARASDAYTNCPVRTTSARR